MYIDSYNMCKIRNYELPNANIRKSMMFADYCNGVHTSEINDMASLQLKLMAS